MKCRLPGLLAAGLMALPALAMAQDNINTIAVPPEPPMVAAPATPLPSPPPPAALPPGGLVQTPLPPVYDSGSANTDTDNGNAAAPGTAAANPGAPPAAPNNWVPKQTAIIGVLNKVDGSVANVTIPVGGESTVGDLQVAVLACAIRPPDEVPDAAVFLSAGPPNNPSAPPIYRGWMVRSLPGATVVGNASNTFRIVGCS